MTRGRHVPDFKRSERFNRVLKEEVNALLIREVRDPRVKEIVITDVECSDDLQHARIFYTLPLEAEPRREQVQAGLDQAGVFIRGRLGQELHVRRVPELRFIYDGSIENATHIENLLRGIKTKEGKDEPA